MVVLGWFEHTSNIPNALWVECQLLPQPGNVEHIQPGMCELSQIKTRLGHTRCNQEVKALTFRACTK